MTTQAMNHQQALETNAAERYLLREMDADQRRAFEEHYLECSECLQTVTFGAEFLEAGHAVALERKSARQNVPVPTWRERLMAVVSGGLRPASALAFALLLCLGGLNVYQMAILHQQKNMIAELKAPKQEFRFTISGAARRGPEAANSFNVSRRGQLNLRFEFQPGQYTGYQAEIASEDGRLKQVIPLTLAPFESSVTISLPAEALTEGKYSAVLQAQSPSGEQSILASDSFELKFAN